MQSTRSRALIGVAALAAVVALFFILRDGDDDEASSTATSNTTAETTAAAETAPDQSGGQGNGEPQPPPNDGGDQVATIVVKGAEPVGGVQDLTFTEGEDIRFVVESDVADEIHLHGYDVAMDVEAGGSVEFDVPATLTGVFEVELEQRVVPIAEITVDPA